MTTTTITRPHADIAGPTPRRAIAIARLIVANPWTTLILPWIILGVIFAGNWLIWLMLSMALGPEAMANAQQGMMWSGASTYAFIYMLVVATQAVNAAFPLALGWGATRRAFSLGSGLLWVALSALYAAGYTLLGLVEELTGGWGLGGRMFTAVYFGDGAWWTRFPIILAYFLFFFFFGSVVASIYVRWRSNGVLLFFAVVGIAALGGALLVTLSDAWIPFWLGIAALGAGGIAAWSLPVSAIAAVGGWLLLRRATPRV